MQAIQDNSLHPEHQQPDVAQLVGQVYAEAPLPLRGHLLEPLLKPLGLLALAGVCNGAFAYLALARGRARGKVRSEDLLSVQVGDVVTLARFVFQVSEQAVEGLAAILAATPALPRSAAWQNLMQSLTQQLQRMGPAGRYNDDDLLDA